MTSKKRAADVLDAVAEQIRAEGEEIDVENLTGPLRAAATAGRPPVAEEKRRKNLIKVLVTDAEYQDLLRSAKSSSMSLATWVRVVALQKAREMKRAAEDKAAHGDHGDLTLVHRGGR